jgi:hypothetical protein
MADALSGREWFSSENSYIRSVGIDISTPLMIADSVDARFMPVTGASRDRANETRPNIIAPQLR